MNLITLSDAKAYLRVDTSDDDALIAGLLESAGRLAADVARLSDDEWAEVDGAEDGGEDGDEAESLFSSSELTAARNLMRVAILYALAYMYEHREEADHRKLALTLRAILSSMREGVV